MAIVWAFRIGIMVAPAAFRWAATGGSPPTQGFTTYLQENATKWMDPLIDTITATDQLQDGLPEGSFVVVTDFAAPFETRKLTVRFARTPPGMVAEDIDVINMHFLKAPGGTPTDSWVDSDYTTLESAFDTLFGSLKTRYQSWFSLAEYRWYADGPAYHPAPSGGNPARRVTTRSVVGTSSAALQLPPQDAHTVTFVTAHRRGWGRVYLPAFAGSSAYVTTNGNMNTTDVDAVAALWVTFFNAARAANLLPVVQSNVHNTCYTVDSIQVDDLIDIMRKRRWKRADYKKVTALT